MIEAQWGLKEKVLADPAIWLCHNCGDCTKNVRVAPGRAMFSAPCGRRLSSTTPGRDSWAGWSTVQKHWPCCSLFRSLIFGMQWAIGPEESDAIGSSPRSIRCRCWRLFFFTVAGLVVVSFAVGISRFVKALRASGANGSRFLSNLVPVITETLSHKRFHDCGPE